MYLSTTNGCIFAGVGIGKTKRERQDTILVYSSQANEREIEIQESL